MTSNRHLALKPGKGSIQDHPATMQTGVAVPSFAEIVDEYLQIVIKVS